jgi:hypothetical protein
VQGYQSLTREREREREREVEREVLHFSYNAERERYNAEKESYNSGIEKDI